MSKRAILVMCLAVSAVELGLDWLHPQLLRFGVRAVFEATMITINIIFVLRSVQRRTAQNTLIGFRYDLEATPHNPAIDQAS